MAEYVWPAKGTATLIGKPLDRTDGIPKTTGAAKYSYDINPPKMLIAKVLGCPHAHCKIKSIDTSAAEKVKGVVAVKAVKKVDDEIEWQGDQLVIVAAESEAAAAEGVKAVKIDYEMLDVFVKDEDLEAATSASRTADGQNETKLENEAPDDADEDEFANQEIDRLLKDSKVVVEGTYGIQVITHMCMEPHGSTCEWNDGKLLAHLSTQNVSGTAAGFAEPLQITANDVTVHCDYIGGGFGSKFSADPWGVACAQISKETGRPVKLMLDRDQELKTAGCRPSGFVKVRAGADENGVVTVWDSLQWGTDGPTGGGISPSVVPYVIVPKNRRSRQVQVKTNAGPMRAWRAPNHPQGCAISHTVFDDVAAKLGLDSYDVFMANLPNVSNKKDKVYADQMAVGAKLIDWKAKWHPHGKGRAKGSIVSGLGMALHTWGGGGHNSSCLIKIHPDGGVETSLGSQDIGTGTRTVIGMVVAETLGLPLSAVKVNIGISTLPPSGPSGGSTTVGGVSESNRRGAIDAREKIFELAAKKLGVEASTLEAKDGRVQVAGDAKKGLSWKEACSLLGMKPLEVRGDYERLRVGDSKLSSAQVAGVQMAEVDVDKETGVVKVKKFVAVQDMGLIVNPKSAASQIYGAVIMGIAFALYEERIMDANNGAFLNAEIADYKLPRLGDIGDIVVELYEPESEYNRGVIGLGEPPVISPGAAISNAVANALGVRVPVLPMTPKRVLDAIAKGGNA